MSDCIISLNIAGNKEPVKFTIPKETLDSSGSEIELLANLLSKNSERNKIVDNLISSILNTTYVEYAKEQGVRYMPSYSGASLKEAFPEYVWGDNIEDICLVNEIPTNLLYSDSGNYFGFRAMRSMNGKNSFIYVIPKNQLKNFAKFTVAKTAAEKLKNYSISEDGKFNRELNEKEQLELLTLLEESTPITVFNEDLMQKIQDKIEEKSSEPNPELVNYYLLFNKDLNLLNQLQELKTRIGLVDKVTITQNKKSKSSNILLKILKLMYNKAIKEIPVPSLFKSKKPNWISAADRALAILDKKTDTLSLQVATFLRSLKGFYNEYLGKGNPSINTLTTYFEIENFDDLVSLAWSSISEENGMTLEDVTKLMNHNSAGLGIIPAIQKYRQDLKLNLLTKQFLLTAIDDYLLTISQTAKQDKVINPTALSILKLSLNNISKNKTYQTWIPKTTYESILDNTEGLQKIQDNFELNTTENEDDILEDGIEKLHELANKPISEFIDLFLHPDSNLKALEKLDTDINVISNDIIHLLAGYKSRLNSLSNFINYCEYILSKHKSGNHGYLTYKEVEDYLVQKMILPKRQKGEPIPYDAILAFVKLNLTNADERFYIDYKRSKGNNIPIGITTKTTFGELNSEDVTPLRSDSSQETVFLRLSTVYNMQPLTDESGNVIRDFGFYTYYYNGKYFNTRNPWSYYDKVKLYDTLYDAQTAKYEDFRKQKLYSGLFLNRGLFKNSEITEPIATPKGRIYKLGLLVEMIDYDFNDRSYSVNQDLTVGEYLDNLQRAYPSINFIKELNSTEKLAMLYSKIDNKFNESTSQIKEIIEEIKAAPVKTMMAINTTKAVGHINSFIDNRTYYTRFREVPSTELNFTESEIGSHRNIYSIVDWAAIQNIFNLHGIPMIILSELLVNEIQEKQPGARVNAFTSNGIIYINPLAASFDTAFHEYTHILLGIIKNQNPDIYTLLIEKYQQSITPERFADKLKLYKKLNEVDIYEEMFADDFASYLSTNHTTYSDIFGIATQLIENSDIWDSAPNLIENANKKFGIFRTLLNGFLASKKNIGMGLFRSEVTSNKYEKYKNILDGIKLLNKSDFDNLNNNSENGIYKYC